jgi:anaerobic magnesium-protoporphyrin IX monomethyl ester cyclase
MADILLTHSYHLYYDRKQVRKMQPYAPLGTLYAASLLEDRGYKVAVFDTMLNDPSAGFAEALRESRPKIVAVYEDNFNFLSKMCLTRMRDVAFRMAEQARAAGAIPIVNGSDATDHTANYLSAGFEAVLLGEAEWTLLETVRALAAGSTEYDSIPGLAFLDGSGKPRHSAPRPIMRNIDVLPLPARHLVDMGMYAQAWRKAHGRFSANLVASRGCPFRCNWCAKPIYGNNYHVRSPISVAEEMRSLKYDFGAEHLWFADDLFSPKPQWAEQLADAVEERDAAVPFKVQTRADLLTPAAVAALKRAGCAEVWMGAESGSQKILDAMDKDTRVEDIEQARHNLGEAGIRACYFLQFGYPGENWNDIRKTIDLVRRTRPDDIGVSVSYPLPGTKFHARVQTTMDGKTNWSDSDDLSVMFKSPYTDAFYRALHDALHTCVEQWSKPAPAGTPAADSTDPASSRELWDRVEQMEKLCRNEAPTVLAPEFVYLQAD